MKDFITYLKAYLRQLSLKSILLSVLFAGTLIAFNYAFGIERRIRDLRPWYLSLFGFFFFYSFVFYFSWGLVGAPRLSTHTSRKHFLLILLAAPLYFSFKMIHWNLSPILPASPHYPWDQYALIVLQLPAKFLLLCILLWYCSKLEKQDDASGPALFGLTTRNFRAGPYLLLLALLLPLIALASTRPDFLHTYPKVKNIAFIAGYTRLLWPWQLLYEMSYGLDFLSIELFFRGLLVIGLARYAGEKAILPMAVFYCTIHFGKPLGECISSFFGGLILGVIAMRTRSILGGLTVHLGLAWLMEVGGWLGNLFRF
jgi:Type II CAAX prenyl endopeptidase Rce1-like